MRTAITRARACVEADPRLLDALLATALVVAAVIGLSGDVDAEPGYRRADPLAYLIAVAGIVPYYFRRRAPLLVLVVATAPLLVMIGRGYTSGALGAGMFILAYTVAAWRPWRELVAAGLLFAAVLSTIMVLRPSYLRTAGLVTNVVLVCAALTVGRWVQTRRAYIGWVEERAALLERAREQRAHEAVILDRLRIARELHDVVAGSMGVIAVQAGVGEHVIDTDPAQAKQSLHAIAETSRQTLTEIRRILGVLRDGDHGLVGTGHGLTDLDAVVRRVGQAGLDVTVDVVGARRSLPDAADDAAFHVVQEALTNVVRHAGATHASVVLGYDHDAVTLDVVDDGRGTAHTAVPGHGLVGLRERVGALGGRFRAGDRADGRGFEVHARIPTVRAPVGGRS